MSGERDLSLLHKAIAAYAVSGEVERSARYVLAKELADHDVLSKAQIASITRLLAVDLTDAFEKTDYRGGKLNPDTLDAIGEIADMPDAEPRWRMIVDVYERGTSPDMIARLLGESRDAIWNRIRKVRKMEERND